MIEIRHSASDVYLVQLSLASLWQKGFRDETIFIADDRAEAIANGFWDTAEDAEAGPARARRCRIEARRLGSVAAWWQFDARSQPCFKNLAGTDLILFDLRQRFPNSGALPQRS